MHNFLEQNRVANTPFWLLIPGIQGPVKAKVLNLGQEEVSLQLVEAAGGLPNSARLLMRIDTITAVVG